MLVGVFVHDGVGVMAEAVRGSSGASHAHAKTAQIMDAVRQAAIRRIGSTF